MTQASVKTTSNSELQTKFIALSKELEATKLKLKELNAAIEISLLDLVGGQLPTDTQGIYFQDPTDLTVFKIVQPTGTYVEYKTIGYERTKREGEVKGSLSVKEAQDAGFKVK